MRHFIFSTLILLSVSLVHAGPAVLIEDKGLPSSWPEKESKEVAPLSQRSSISEKIYREYANAFELRADRRVGVGLSTAGQMGLYGATIELNFSPKDSAVTGFGGGPRYNAFTMQWKHLFNGKSLAPYFTAGYAHWYSSPGNKTSIDKTTPSVLGNRFLTESEKASGKFAKDFLIPSVGLQYYQLHSEYVGASVYAEVVILMSVEDPTPVPTGALGAVYYF